jgi:hypothetical protein
LIDLSEENRKEIKKNILNTGNSKLTKLNTKKTQNVSNEQNIISSKNGLFSTNNDYDEEEDQFITSYETISIQVKELSLIILKFARPNYNYNSSCWTC